MDPFGALTIYSYSLLPVSQKRLNSRVGLASHTIVPLVWYLVECFGEVQDDHLDLRLLLKLLMEFLCEGDPLAPSSIHSPLHPSPLPPLHRPLPVSPSPLPSSPLHLSPAICLTISTDTNTGSSDLCLELRSHAPQPSKNHTGLWPTTHESLFREYNYPSVVIK